LRAYRDNSLQGQEALQREHSLGLIRRVTSRSRSSTVRETDDGLSWRATTVLRRGECAPVLTLVATDGACKRMHTGQCLAGQRHLCRMTPRRPHLWRRLALLVSALLVMCLAPLVRIAC
jgi:type II secretory pathway component PulL